MDTCQYKDAMSDCNPPPHPLHMVRLWLPLFQLNAVIQATPVSVQYLVIHLTVPW